MTLFIRLRMRLKLFFCLNYLHNKHNEVKFGIWNGIYNLTYYLVLSNLKSNYLHIKDKNNLSDGLTS